MKKWKSKICFIRRSSSGILIVVDMKLSHIFTYEDNFDLDYAKTAIVMYW